MNPLQSHFVKAFRSWDGRALGRAIQTMVEALLEHPLSAVEVDEVQWSARELLEAMEGHPRIDSILELGGVRFQLRGDVELTTQPGRRPHPALLIGLAPGPERRDRWVALGFSQEMIALPRSDMSLPFPLKGEPGYDPARVSPSIHRPPFVAPTPSITWAAGRALAHERGPWLARYRAGDTVGVWREMAALGDHIRAPEVLGDAVAVALETMRRCRAALEVLAERLERAGYQFERPEEVLRPPTPAVGEMIDRFETKEVGLLPLSLCAFVEVVGSVDFCGRHPYWQPREEAVLDPVVVDRTEYLLTHDETNWSRGEYVLAFAPDRFHKEDISGGAPYSLALPNAAVDVVVRDERHGIAFVELLRRSVRCAGFPGWEDIDVEERADLTDLVGGIPLL